MRDLVLDETHNVENDNDDGHVVAGVPSELFHSSRATHVEDLLAQFRERLLLRKKMTIDDVEARAGTGARFILLSLVALHASYNPLSFQIGPSFSYVPAIQLHPTQCFQTIKTPSFDAL